MTDEVNVQSIYLSIRKALSRAVSSIVPPHDVEDIVQETPPLLQPSEEIPVQEDYEEVDIVELMHPESLDDAQDIQISSDDSITYIHVPIPGIKPQLDSIEKIAKETPAAVKKGYVVQLGAFADLSKAEQQQKNLVSNGINAYTETVRADNNQQVTRVRIGPYPSRVTAEDELAELRKLGLDGVVTAQ